MPPGGGQQHYVWCKAVPSFQIKLTQDLLLKSTTVTILSWDLKNSLHCNYIKVLLFQSKVEVQDGKFVEIHKDKADPTLDAKMVREVTGDELIVVSFSRITYIFSSFLFCSLRQNKWLVSIQYFSLPLLWYDKIYWECQTENIPFFGCGHQRFRVSILIFPLFCLFSINCFVSYIQTATVRNVTSITRHKKAWIHSAELTRT